ncbi:MAG: glycosyltransferase family 2 protein [Bacteroidia bacterium]
MNNTPSLTIIIPAYNEEKSLPLFLPQVLKFCNDKNHKLIIVNDGSKDQTAKVLEGFSGESRLKVLHNKVNSGYGGAIKKGVRAADTDFVVTIDADGQHYPDDLEKLFQRAIETDADMVVGCRKNISGFYRGLGKWIIRRVAGMLMPLHISDINTGMKLFHTELGKKYITICPDGFACCDIILLVFIFKKHRVIEVPITSKPRTQGKSKVSTMTAIDTLREIMNIVVLFNPIRIFLPASIFCILISLLWNIHIFLNGKGVSGGSLLGILTGIIIFFFGVLAHQVSAFRRDTLE